MVQNGVMSRPREFDRSNSVVIAMQLFWQRGYTATSLGNLLTALQIGRGSFYAAFGDKQSLYAECLRLFSNRTLSELKALVQPHNYMRLTDDFFEKTIFGVPQWRRYNGCMMVNTLFDSVAEEPLILAQANDGLADVEGLFIKVFDRAQVAGQLDSQHDTASLARFVMLVNQGLRVSCRKRRSDRYLRGELDNALAFLPGVFSRSC